MFPKFIAKLWLQQFLNCIAKFADQFLTAGMITKESAMVLENQIKVVGKINKQYSDEFKNKEGKIGSVINLRKPPRYLGRSGQALSLEDITETSVPLALTTQFGVDITFTTADLALNINMFSKNILSPAIKAIANRVDFDSTLLYQTVYNTIGTPGSTPNSFLTFLNVNQRLNEEACPVDGRSIFVTPAIEATAVDAFKGLFNSQKKLGEAFEKGMMQNKSLGFDEWLMDQNLRTHTVGALGGVPTVNLGGQTGNSLVTQAWSNSITGVLKRGDVFTIGAGATGVFAVNPQNRQNTGALRQFVCTADQNSSGAGAVTIPISPSIIVSGPFQNVTGQTAAITGPANAATINVLGAASTNTPQALAFVEDAFCMGTCDLPLPDGVDFKGRENYKGLSIRIIRNYDINTDRLPCRTDILYGFAALYPELACRLAS